MAPPPPWPSANHELVYGWRMGSEVPSSAPLPLFRHATVGCCFKRRHVSPEVWSCVIYCCLFNVCVILM